MARIMPWSQIPWHVKTNTADWWLQASNYVKEAIFNMQNERSYQIVGLALIICICTSTLWFLYRHYTLKASHRNRVALLTEQGANARAEGVYIRKNRACVDRSKSWTSTDCTRPVQDRRVSREWTVLHGGVRKAPWANMGLRRRKQDDKSNAAFLQILQDAALVEGSSSEEDWDRIADIDSILARDGLGPK